MALTIDAIAQRYSTDPEGVEQMPLERFYTAVTIIEAENLFRKRESQKIKARSKMKR